MKRDATLPLHLHICFSSCSIQFNFINPRRGNWFKGKKKCLRQQDKGYKNGVMVGEKGGGSGAVCGFCHANFVWRPEWGLHCVGSVFLHLADLPLLKWSLERKTHVLTVFIFPEWNVLNSRYLEEKAGSGFFFVVIFFLPCKASLTIFQIIHVRLFLYFLPSNQGS